jgi:hypothetical protein
LAVLVSVVCFCLSNALGAQRPGARGPENSVPESDERFERPGSSGSLKDDQAKQQRRTPLGIQVPVDRDLREQHRGVGVERESNALQRIGILPGSPDQPRTDLVADGTVTVYTENGPIAFGVTLVQNGEHGSQRILLRQPDGKLWDGRADHLVPGAGPALDFLETQYRRGLQQLMKSPEHDGTIVVDRIKDAFRVVTEQEENGQSTRYSLDPATSQITGFEFERSRSRDSAGSAGPVVHSYSLADFRAVDGVATPFHIDHFVDGEKKEELQLTKVRYNTAVTGAPAVRSTGR